MVLSELELSINFQRSTVESNTSDLYTNVVCVSNWGNKASFSMKHKSNRFPGFQITFRSINVRVGFVQTEHFSRD